MTFTVGAATVVSFDAIHPQGTNQEYSNLGVEAFFRYDVPYDFANGQLGFPAAP